MTNSLIALTLSGNPSEFKRAFSGATLNDMFNFLTTGVLLPLEITTHFMFILSRKMTDLMPFENADAMAAANFMAYILDPVKDLFILLDKDAVNAVANGADVTHVALRCCATLSNQTVVLGSPVNGSQLMLAVDAIQNNSSSFGNQTICLKECDYWCMPMVKALGDGGTGLFWIIMSIVVLIACLFGIVKVLSLLIVGPIAKAVNTGREKQNPNHFELSNF